MTIAIRPEGLCARETQRLTRHWGDPTAVQLYLDRCQVDTPDDLVAATWQHIIELRGEIGKAVDFGAGDGRFARYGRYHSYIGYEIDKRLCEAATLPSRALLVNKCAFSDRIDDADLCIGNPPFVRNQDLPSGWRQEVSSLLSQRTGVTLSGLANAWQYFFLLALASLKPDGLCALVIPFEWVSRPSARILRDYISSRHWNVSVYRLIDSKFNSVLTTSSITIVDKRQKNGCWKYFEETGDGEYKMLPSPSGSDKGVLPYLRRSAPRTSTPRAIRGLSPGTQTVLTLTEGERVRNGLKIGRDVVPCITTLRLLPPEIDQLTDSVFDAFYRSPGAKCWLLRTDKAPSSVLQAYLEAVPASAYQTATCLEREAWWKFNMPPVPALFVSQSFKGRFPKAVQNPVNARAVGGVSGIYDVTDEQALQIVRGFDGLDITGRVVSHSNGLRKIEINQLNALFEEFFGK